MQDQGSPVQPHEFRIAYVEKRRAIPRNVTSIRTPEIEPGRETTKATAEKKRRRWAFSELLVGSCPEYLEAFARSS